MQELVTIAIPAYKRRWLAEAIDSALAQDYKNIELVIVNDHSPQNLDKVVEPYLSDSRVRYFVNEKNLGKESIVHNWNRCLELARGEYFVLLCDDDLLMPNFVSTLLALAEKYPHCNVFHGRRQIKKDSSEGLLDELIWPEHEDVYSYIQAELHRQRKHTVTEFLLRTENLRANPYPIFPIGFYSDNAVVVQQAMEGGVCSCSKPVCVFRENDEHLSKPSSQNFIKAQAAILYYQWLADLLFSGDRTKTYGQLDYDVHYYCRLANYWDRVRIVLKMPKECWGFRQKLLRVCGMI